jgi:DNA-binding NtrC family response regulator
VIISDIRMPNIKDVEAIDYFQQQYPRVSLIVPVGNPGMETATPFLKMGVVDYLIKPADKENLLHAVTKAVAQRELNRL